MTTCFSLFSRQTERWIHAKGFHPRPCVNRLITFHRKHPTPIPRSRPYRHHRRLGREFAGGTYCFALTFRKRLSDPAISPNPYRQSPTPPRRICRPTLFGAIRLAHGLPGYHLPGGSSAASCPIRPAATHRPDSGDRSRMRADAASTSTRTSIRSRRGIGPSLASRPGTRGDEAGLPGGSAAVRMERCLIEIGLACPAPLRPRRIG